MSDPPSPVPPPPAWLDTWRAVVAERCSECDQVWEDAAEARKDAGFAAVALLSLVPVLALLGVTLASRASTPTVEAQVIDARIGTEQRAGRAERTFGLLEVRYTYAGRGHEAQVRQPGSSRDLERAQAFVAARPVGSAIALQVSPDAPEEPRLPTPLSGWWVFGLALLAYWLVDGVDTLAGSLQRRRVHLAEHLAPRQSRARFDHDPALVRWRLLGPCLHPVPHLGGLLLFAGLGLVACLASRPSPGWWALPAVWSLAAVVGGRRLLDEVRAFHRFRNAVARLEAPAGFAPGRTYTVALVGAAARPADLRVALEYREEAPDDDWDGDGDGVWEGAATAIAPAAIDGLPGSARVTFTLPVAAPAPHLRGEARRQWTLRVEQGRATVYFDLDFAPEPPPPPRPPRPFPDAARWLEETRAKLGPAPRDGEALRGLSAVRPEWMEENDRLLAAYREQRLLLRYGRVVWGFLVQANEQLFQPGEVDCPADLIYALDPSWDGRLGELAAVADRLFATKGSPVDRLSQALADEHVRLMRYPLPEWLLAEEAAYNAAVMVIRAHLPDGVLQRRFVPLLVDPDKTEVALILPARFWSEGLLAAWRGEGGQS